MVFSNDKIRQQLATRVVHQANINATNLQNFDIRLPPLPEQRRIADILSAVDRKLELERRRKEKLERVKKGLMNELLTGRKRVKVD
jgi:type I restriction enzyme S subunit